MMKPITGPEKFLINRRLRNISDKNVQQYEKYIMYFTEIFKRPCL